MQSDSGERRKDRPTDVAGSLPYVQIPTPVGNGGKLQCNSGVYYFTRTAVFIKQSSGVKPVNRIWYGS